MANYSRKIIADGVGYSTVIDPKFKSNKVQVIFVTDLLKETAAENAMAIGVLGSSNSKYKNISEITAKLNSLYGANISISVNKQGDYQKLSIGVSSIHNRFALEGEDISGEVLEILLDCIFSPNAENVEFGKEPFDFRKKDLLDTIEAEINNKRGYAVLQANRKAFDGENSGNSPYGDKESATAVTSADAYKAYKRLLANSQVEIYFVGSEDDPSIEEKMTKAFSSINRSYNKCNFINFSTVKNEICRFEEKLDVTQCKMVMAFKSQNEDNYAMKLMNTILGATPFSKLFLNVREKLSLCYYCASNYSMLKGAVMIDCGVEQENIEKAEKEIINQIEEMKKGNFTQEDIDNSILSIANSLKGVGDTLSSYINWYYGCFVQNELITPEQALEKYKAVTKQQIIDAAKSLQLDTVYVMKGEE